MKHRITYLDGHRGVAILLVILFHAYARWPDIVPYGHLLQEVPLFKYGYVGVQLFFLISGFVILMTLEKCETAGEFLFRRWLRLFPAMLVCSIFIYLTSGLFWERPAGEPTLSSVLPGLTFIEPDWWQLATSRTFVPLEGAFWSLYVEFKFYVFAALIYYWRGRNALFAALLSAFALSVISTRAFLHVDNAYLHAFRGLVEALSFEHFGWFAAGAAFYVCSKDRRPAWFLGALLIAICSSVELRGLARGPLVSALLISVWFAASMFSKLVQNVLDTRALQFFGFVSYPLYLLHENMTVSLIVKLGRISPESLRPLMIVPAVAVVALAAYAVTVFVEPRIRNLLLEMFGKSGSQRRA